MSVSYSPKQGYWLRLVEKKSLSFSHQLGGAHDIPGAGCPNCKKPLLQLLSLDPADERINLAACPLDRFPVLYCWTCNVAQDDFYYQLQGKEVRLIKYKKGGVELDFPYRKYPVYFPASLAELHPLTNREQDAIHAINQGDEDAEDENPNLSVPAHQIGGEPIYLDRGRSLRCLACKSEIPLLATVADNAGKQRSFTRNEFVQVMVFVCRKCWVVGCYQQCD
jgi:thiol-disulfide isomerase/thioredoxin